MDRFQRSWFRLLAKNSYLELKRQEFQGWIGRIIEVAKMGDYTSIRLTQGDGGLDGIILSESAVIAVYAPRHSTKSGLEAKIASDFESAKQTLGQRAAKLKKFILIHNDEGLTKDVGTFLLSLRQKEPESIIELWTFERLWMLLEQLTEDQLSDLLGMAPSSEVMARLEMPAVREVVEHLASVRAKAPPLQEITIPDPEKLAYNRLNEYNQHMLKGGRSKHGLVQHYFDGVTEPNLGESLAEAFRCKYASCRESGMEPDEIFEVLWHLAGGDHFTSPPQQAAVTAVLSHFFDSCDIFENVPEST